MDQPSGSTNSLKTEGTTESTFLWANISCVHIHSVSQNRPYIQRQINSLTLLCLPLSTQQLCQALGGWWWYNARSTYPWEPVRDVPGFDAEIADPVLAREHPRQAWNGAPIERCPEDGLVGEVNGRHARQLAVDESSVHLFDVLLFRTKRICWVGQNSASLDGSVSKRQACWKVKGRI